HIAVRIDLVRLAADHVDADSVRPHLDLALRDQNVARIGAGDLAAIARRRILFGDEAVRRNLDRLVGIMLGRRRIGESRARHQHERKSENALHFLWPPIKVICTWPFSTNCCVLRSTSNVSDRNAPDGPCPLTGDGPCMVPFLRSTSARAVWIS